MVFGNMYTHKIACANNNGATQSFANVAATQKLFKIISTRDVYIKLQPASNTDAADNSDYLIKANVEVEFLVGRGLDRIVIRNESGNAAAIHVAVMY